MFFKLLILPIFLLLQFKCFAQITIDLKNGKTFTGYILNEDDSILKFTTLDSISWDIPKDQIKKINPIIYKFRTNKGESYTGTIIKPPDSNYSIRQSNGLIVTIHQKDLIYLSTENYSILGATYGFHGSINVLFCQHFGDFAIRADISGPFGGTIWGFQLNLCYNLSVSKSFEHNLSIGAGYCEDVEEFITGSLYGKTEKLRYIGIFYDFIKCGFFLEVGLNFRSGSDFMSGSIFNYNPLSLQIGYVYSFND